MRQQILKLIALMVLAVLVWLSGYYAGFNDQLAFAPCTADEPCNKECEEQDGVMNDLVACYGDE